MVGQSWFAERGSYFLENFWTLTLQGLVVGAIYALVALGYTLVYGVLRLINFAHSEVFMIGTFAVVWSLTAVGAHMATGLPLIGFLLVGLISAMAASGAVAVVLEYVAYRPLRKRNAPPLIALISAIGASFVLSELIGRRDLIADLAHLRGPLDPYVNRALEQSVRPDLFQTAGVVRIFDYELKNTEIIILLGSLVVMVVLDQFIKRSRLGRGVRAVAMDAESAALMGVNRDKVIRVTFLIGGLMAGVAAFLYMLKVGQTKYNAGFILGVKAFTAAVLGGIGNLRGALLGGFVLGVAENWGTVIVGSNWQDVVSFILLIVILLFRPTGLLGESLGRARA